MKKSRLLILIFFLTLFSIPRVVDAAPANASFHDDEFYKCIVDTINHDQNKSYGYDVAVTDEELSQVVDLVCFGEHGSWNVTPSSLYDISDTTGLNKLTGLQRLTIAGHHLETIDVSSNTNLARLDLSHNNLTTVDVSHNTNLNSLTLTYNELESMDVSHNTELTFLDLNFNASLSSLNLGTISKVKFFYLRAWNITSLDLTHMTLLKDLALDVHLTNLINLSTLVNLEKLYIADDNLTSIDLTHNTKLEKLYLYCNSITSLDISKNTALAHIEIYDYNLKNIGFENNPELKELILTSTAFENKLKFYNNTKLQSVFINMNKNNSMYDFAHCENLYNLDLGILEDTVNPKVYLPLGTILSVYDMVFGPEGQCHDLSVVGYTGERTVFDYNDCDTEVFGTNPGTVHLKYNYDRELDLVVGSGAPRDLSDIDLEVEVPNTALNVSKLYLIVSLVFIISGLIIILKIVLNKEKKLNN